MRDKTLVTGHGPEGNPIPQFNPNTAGVVIIGSVTIGADSSFGSGPFAYAGSSIASSGSFFLFDRISCRQDLPANKGGTLQRDDMSLLSSATLAVAWQRRGAGGGSAKRGGGAQCNGGSAVAAAQRLRRWRQHDSATSAAAWRRQRRWQQRKAWRRGTARRRQRGGSSTDAAAVAAAGQREVGGSGIVRECADARAFERHRRADVCVFVLGRGRRDDSVDSIVVGGSDGVAHGNVHRGCRCAAAAAATADGDADDIVC
jgi:hypothetical protein